MSLPEISVIVLSYLLGCICTGYYLVRFKTGKDIRQTGSGTAGARNAGREVGKAGFAVTFIGDLAKGSAAVMITRLASQSSWVTALALVAVVLGHMFPLQLGFKGGKGLSTLTGGVLVLNAELVLLLCLVLALLVIVTKAYKLCGLLMVAVLPFAAMPAVREPAHVTGIAVAAALVLMAHRRDIAVIVSPSSRGNVVTE